MEECLLVISINSSLKSPSPNICKETLLKLENRLIQWLDGKEINFDDIGKRNYNQKERVEE